MGEIIAWPKPPTPLPITGERLTSSYGGQTEIEHLHRYLMAREWCRGKDVLDVASGEGYGTALLAQVAHKALGVEIAPDVVDHANSSYQTDNLAYLAGDARALPCADASFDVVTSFETIEHFAEQDVFLGEVRRVLRPGGLFIVSTPDRDNYSPAESPANPFHLKELTRAEFEKLMRTYFAEAAVLLQRPVFGSVLLPNGAGTGQPSCFERRGDGHFEGSIDLPRPQYIIAFASDRRILPLSPSVYIDTGRLGMLRPSEAEAELRLLRNEVKNNKAVELDPLRSELSTCRDQLSGLLAANEISEQARALAHDELARAREEVKGLLAANEMSERACALARDQLANALELANQERTRAREEVKGLVAANEMAERACALAGEQLVECQEQIHVLSRERTHLAERLARKNRPWPVRLKGELRRFGRRLRRKS